MKKVSLIKPEDFFAESEKVIQIVKDREDDVRRTLPANLRLTAAKEALEKANTREEYEKLQETIKDIEYEIKYGKDSIPAIPEEHQNKIAFNRVTEEEKIDLEISKQKEMLHELIDGIENPLTNILRNIEALEKRKLVGKKIDILLDDKITLDGRIHSVFGHSSYLAFSAEHDWAKDSLDISKELFKVLNKIAKAPKQPNGIKKPTVLNRILGGGQ